MEREGEAAPLTEPAPEPEGEAAPLTEPEPESEAEAVLPAEQEPEPVLAESEAVPETTEEAEPEPEPAPDAEAVLHAESEPEPEPAPDAEAVLHAESEPERAPEPAAEPVLAKSEPEPEQSTPPHTVEARSTPSLRRVAVVAIAAVVVVAAAALARTTIGSHPSRAAPLPRSPDLVSSSSADVGQPPPDPTPSTPGTTVASGENESDPLVLLDSDHYFLYTSGIPSATPINVPVSSSTDFIHWTPVTDAMPVLPGWVVPGFTWAPEVHRFGSHYVLYFTAAVKHTGLECIGASVSSSPTGPFTARRTPFICQAGLGGSIDPRVFTDPRGTVWMLWKSDQNRGGASIPTTLWSQQLTPDGLGLVGPSHDLMGPDEPWQGTIVEAPDLVDVNGVYWIFYSGNWFNQRDYAIGAARCSGPEGPCADTTNVPLLASNAQGAGPGEASVFTEDGAAWMLYSPVRAVGGNPPRPVDITRLGFTAAGPYLAAGGPPPALPQLSGPPVWSAP